MNPAVVFRNFLKPFFRQAKGDFNFMAAARRFEDRLDQNWRNYGFSPPSKGKKVGVLVTPWLFTPAPFFVIECGLLLRERGYDIVFLWDACDVFLNVTKPREANAILAALSKLPVEVGVIDIGKIPISSRDNDYPFLALLLYENAVRHLGGEKDIEEFFLAHPTCKTAMKQHCDRVDSLLNQYSFDSLLIPGGVWASSGIYANLAQKYEIPFTTYDSGVQQLFVVKNSATAHFGDVHSTLELLLASANSKELEQIRELAWVSLDKRMRGEDTFRLQQSPLTGSKTGYDVLVPLNLRYDSAALCRQRLFESVTHWLTSLLRWLETKDGITLAIRQHPCERIEAYRGSDTWSEVLSSFRHLGNRLRFISANAQVNTYDLIHAAKVILPFTSRVGIEAAMLDKCVITSTDCYYGNCGFTIDPTSIHSYFEAIESAMMGKYVLNESQKSRAETVYYLMEYCACLSTPFTPQPADFDSWMRFSPRDLLGREDVRLILRAISEEQSLAWWQHQLRMGNKEIHRLSI